MKISRLGWSLPAAAILTLTAVPTARAQEAGAAQPATHTVKEGDTLWDIARAYLGDPYLWPSIYRLNTDQIEDPHWIYPGEVLRLPGGAAPEVIAQQPRSEPGPSVFRPVGINRIASAPPIEAPPAHVAIGSVIRAAFVGPEKGPTGSGKLLFREDIPGIEKERLTSNFTLYDNVLMVPPVGSVAAERERFVSYVLGATIDGVGTIVIPTGVVEVVRAPRNGEAAMVRVLALFGMVDGNARVMALDTAGAGASTRPLPFADTRVTTIRAVHRTSVLPSLDYEVLFDLAAKDGMRIGDEIQIFRARQGAVQDERPAIPEVAIATAQVVRVTPYGSTARITSHQQPAIRVGESIRLTARMP